MRAFRRRRRDRLGLLGAARAREDGPDVGFVEALANAAWPFFRAWFDPDVRGFERIPAGAAVVVGNHGGGPNISDVFVFCAALVRERGGAALPRPLGHALLFRLPGLGGLFERAGVVPASRENAGRILEAGGQVLVYPGGEIETFRPRWQRDRVVFGGRQGYVRLALRRAVPIVPVVAAGGHETLWVLASLPWLADAIGARRWLGFHVWPLTFSIPWGLWLGPVPPHLPLPTRISIEVLEPIHFERTGEEAAADAAYVAECAARVETLMQETLTRLSRERRERGRWPRGVPTTSP